ncbi:tRNA (N6-isopentenyl adenosine(37)-C2)-methylthiotransferase MiaB [Sulfuricurvum sp. RIFCSPLOWO2_12_FULL_43_24]|uniref:tRNA (N6-isopentenyl adenosine(37)-C2)-methylthiotransferase MiaB n=1 Tax=Sulfuricurvum sp. RIFCSPLOWO2_12_FULL_43_24 TaxID=1802247 RepID=UPI0008ACC54D|nr:tRNA (N6-isopentenyl adenosine(37)-C2)-methylthiotransferase MiaB [Sulfuricurvum sp. RIFCSPLOWO2_12_FULL_43_24]OHD83039.1 MAG: tRNA (N6-isopentenyl adenosine(37)-C2)-methylthiotransferase MiaB [Sulfuricurvum sp. RIFCSPHIGHO2_02_FULL_43_9]OHD85661.1 MAG: tRNA (N6-isopentenyl adenosine(37)-C2)-methylthiotransferase MiaB [Sulfuricurvum sp. RIFCSPLOWO2_02_FULL_43_45]OHD88911.1 MAG: tRNA (N6-isopentenyl adenosine(37)-C2)-methylthiotransferase MiaB [Sulfuricurvum sp. RIFCSPLOWO2_12_FULL_43_24]
MSKKLFIETLGCAMNTRDSEHMIAELNAHEGYELTDDASAADLILINTCSVREKPVHKLFSELGVFNKLKKADAKIGVCGCTASHLGKEIIKRAPYVNFVLGARNVSKIADVLHRDKAVEIEIDYDESQFAFKDFRSSPYKAYINISIGCDKQCTFCIVPKTRGDEISIPPDLIVAEARKAVEKGAKEVFLLGQNVNNYGRRLSGGNEKINFTELLRRVSAVEGLERIRFTSPHPLHMDDEFIEEFARNPKICKSMHMPLQSGSTEILKAMKRGYTKEWFLNRARKLRELVPNVSISTDIIVAFPGESDEDFEETMEVLNQVRFEQLFSFKYSPRPLTEAEKMEEVDSEVGSERLSRLQARHDEILDEMKLVNLGKIVEVYFEELREGGYVAGRSDNNLGVKVKGSEEMLGTIASVKITEVSRNVQYGEIIA